MKLALVIVSYNSYLDIENLLVSLRAQQRQGDLVIVVDNCSPNGDGDRLMNRATDWGFSYISAPENNGFAAGCNIGIEYARTLGATHIGLINPDTLFVFEDTLAQMEVALFSGIYGIIGTYILSAGTRQIEFAGADMISPIFYPKIRKHGELYSEKDDTLKVVQTDYTTGSSLFFSLKVADTIGLMDESYFLYFEETDWCLRARQYGYQIGIITSTALEHKTSQSIGFRSALYVTYMVRNYAKFALRYAKWYELPFWMIIYIGFWIPGQTASYLYRKIL